MNNKQTIADIRREYGNNMLDDSQADPFALFNLWFEDVLASEKNDPTAMVLSTVDKDGKPDSRVVLLKEQKDSHFIFYTNYDSHKGKQFSHNPWAALNFYWPEMSRQVRIRGQVIRTDKRQSDTYFAQRPLASQLSAIVSPQSQLIASRQLLDDKLQELMTVYQHKTVPRPDNWGGYCVIAEEIEFWQGRDNRLHDRLHYQNKDGKWQVVRLAP